MAFWVRNTSGGTYTINDLGCTLTDLEERDLHLSTIYESLQDSADLVTALGTGDITRLDGPGGATIPAADAFNDATALHLLGGGAHTASTLAELNTLVSDANMDDAGDPRDPNNHASTHKGGGSDAIDIATSTVAGLLSSADKDKLDDLSSGGLYLNCRNETGFDIPIGKLVAADGWDPVNSLPRIKIADKDTAGARPAIGYTETAIVNNTNGRIITTGHAFNINTSTWAVSNQLVLGNNGDFSLPPPGVDPFSGEVQNIAVVVTSHISDGIILLTPTGAPPLTSGQIFALIGSDGNPSKTNPYVTNSDVRLDLPEHNFRVSPSGGDYTSIKAAVDAAITAGASSTNPYAITVYPGTYTEDPMTIQSGIILTTQTSSRSDSVLVVANNAAQDLFTCIGGCIGGLNCSGVTDPTKAIFRAANANTLVVLHGVGIQKCSTGVAISGGAKVIATDFSVNIDTAAIEVGTAISVTDANSYFGCVGGFFNVPDALLPAYAVNPIQTALRVADQAEVYLVGVTARIANKDTTPDTVLADGGSKATILSSEFSNCYRGARIGASGTGTKIIVQGSVMFGNTINGQCDSSTGVFLVNAATDSFKWVPVAGSILSGMVQSIDEDRTYLTGLLSYRFSSDKVIQLEKWFHDQTSTGVSDPKTTLVTAGTGLNVNVAAGDAWVTRHDIYYDSFNVSWETDTVALIADATNYVGYNSATASLEASSSFPGNFFVLLATVITDGSGIRFIHRTRALSKDTQARMQEYLEITRKILLKSGLATVHGSTVVKFEIDGGEWYRSLDIIAYTGTGTDATFSYFYGSNGATEVASQTSVDITQYDNAGTLTAMTASYYRSDTVLLTSDGRISVIYGTEEFINEALAIATSSGATPTFIQDTGIRLARLIIQQGNGITAIVDERPRGVISGSGGTGITVHAGLAGLNADDHLQYLLASGARTMAGNLNMGANEITNVSTIDGVDVSDHSARHNPGGMDALTTAAPVVTQVGASPAEGSAASLARSDHQHGVSAGSPVTVGTANAAGSASTAARSDHVHAHGNQTIGSLHAVATVAVNGFLSASDKTKLDGIDPGATNTPLTSTPPVNVTKAAASAGVATDVSRQDHKHDVGTAAPAAGAVAVGNSASEGSSISLARADHIHTVTGGSPVSVGASLVDGAATTFARADHIHTGLTRGAGDFNSFPGKATTVGTDVLLIEDSESSFAKKRASIQQMREDMPGLPLQTAYVGLTTNVSTNSLYAGGTGYVDMPGMAITIITTKANSILRLELTCCYSNSTAKNVYFRILVDGARTKGSAGSSGPNALQTAALTFHLPVTPGSHSVVVQWCCGGGTASCNPVGVIGTEGDYHHCSLLIQELS